MEEYYWAYCHRPLMSSVLGCSSGRVRWAYGVWTAHTLCSITLHQQVDPEIAQHMLHLPFDRGKYSRGSEVGCAEVVSIVIGVGGGGAGVERWTFGFGSLIFIYFREKFHPRYPSLLSVVHLSGSMSKKTQRTKY